MRRKQYIYRMSIMLILTAFLAVTGLSLNAGDTEAQTELKKGKELFAKGDYRGAAKAYRAAELYADAVEIKYEALTKAADAFEKGGLKYKQFQCYEDLIDGFPDKINFTEIVDKEYQIANDFHNGYRDTPLTWLPWIKDNNKAPEIYEKVLRQAPFAKFAPALKLKLGRIYLEEEKNEKALRTFRQIIKEHPKTKEEKYARFELANALVQLSKKAGDGDGAYAREAEDVLNETLKIYPDDPETLWLKQSLDETDNVRAERLYKLAEFYESRENPEAAKRYFNDLVSRFPKSKYVEQSIIHLKKLDPEYKTPKIVEKAKTINLYPTTEMKSERRVILTTPEASGGKWLLPIEDLDLDGSHAEEDYQAEKLAKEEARKKAEAKRAAEIAARKAERERLIAQQEAKKRAEELKKKEEAEKEAARKEKLKREAEKLQQKALPAKQPEEQGKREREAAKTKPAEQSDKVEKAGDHQSQQKKPKKTPQKPSSAKTEKKKKDSGNSTALKKDADQVSELEITKKNKRPVPNAKLIYAGLFSLLLVTGTIFYVKKR